MKSKLLIAILLASVLFPAVTAATYYVDYSSGNDANTGLSQAAAWKRAPGMVGFAGSYTHQAGDTFIFKGGVTWPSTAYPWTISQGGSSGNPDTYTTNRAWFNGATFSQPVFDDEHAGPGATGMLRATSIGFLTFNDLTFINCGTSRVANNHKCLVFTDTHDISFTDNTFSTESWIGLYFPFLTPGSYSNFYFARNDFSHVSGAIWMASAQSNTAIHNLIYINNTFHDYSSQIGGGVHGDGALHYYSVPSSDSTQYIDGVIFCNNRFYGDFTRSFGTNGAMTGFFFSEGSMTGTICNNEMTFSPVQANMFDGLIVADGYNNQHSMGLNIYGNSMINNGVNAMSAAIHLSRGFQNVVVKNNIISGMSYPIYNEDANSVFTSDYNVINAASGQMVFGSSFQSYTQWRAAGRDTHSVLGSDPQYVAPPSDLHLRATSPAIGAGTSLSNSCTGGITMLCSDISGIPRGTAWDAGAHQRTSGTADTTPPAVTITSPSAGSTVSAAVTITATATDNVAVAGVQFKINGAALGIEDTSSPYTTQWNTTAIANGPHTITATARDSAGNTNTATSTIQVSNTVPDTGAPTIIITAPSQDAAVNGITMITATATDNVAVAGVQFKINGVNLGAEDTSAPYSISWNTSAVTNGVHNISATARDTAANSQTASVRTTVNNTIMPVPGDVNKNGIVDLIDVQLVINDLSKTTDYNPQVDLAPPMGVIDLFDIMIVVRNWGRTS